MVGVWHGYVAISYIDKHVDELCRDVPIIADQEDTDDKRVELRVLHLQPRNSKPKRRSKANAKACVKRNNGPKSKSDAKGSSMVGPPVS